MEVSYGKKILEYKRGIYINENQLLKGILKSCILKIISIEEIYSHVIIIKFDNGGFKNNIEGILYPILKLEKTGLIQC